MRRAALVVAAATAATALLLSACKDEVGVAQGHKGKYQSIPTMVSNNVQTVLSDSGHTRYRVTTDKWLMFEEIDQPYWIFPKGMVAEELDENYGVARTIKCDSAHYARWKRELSLTRHVIIKDSKGNIVHCDTAFYYEDKKLWNLTGGVNVLNQAGDKVLTRQLFWDVDKHQMFSDQFIHIEKDGRVVEGYGYRSNEDLTNYELRKAKAIIPVENGSLPGGM